MKLFIKKMIIMKNPGKSEFFALQRSSIFLKEIF